MTNAIPSIVLIPAYEPGDALLSTVRQLLARGFTVVVVNDGSGARYQAIFDQLSTAVRLIRHDVNKGKGAALKTGYRFIRQHFPKHTIITADADGQHTVADITRVASASPRHPATLLLGSRTFGANDVPLRSKFGNELTRKVYSLVAKQQLSDTQTGLRAFDDQLTEFMLQVPGERFEYEMNVLLGASRVGIPIVELPIQTVYKNNNQSSHFNPLKDSIAIYKEVLKFASSSLASFVLDITLFTLIMFLTSSWTLASSVTFANVVARIISASFNFTINRHLVFERNTPVVRDALGYALLALGILVGNTLLLNLLTFLAVTPLIAKILTELAFFCMSFWVQKHVIFTKKREVKQ